MKPILDYHMHTLLCGHAVGEPFEYVEEAIKKGLTEIGFADHAPLVVYPDPLITMSLEQLPRYHEMIQGLQKEYKDKGITIRLGIEADFIPGYEGKTCILTEGFAYDYVIGSVHFIGDFPFDNPNHKDKLEVADIDQVYRDYHALLRQSAESGLFDILAHVDLVKKFGNRPKHDLSEEITKTAKIFKKAGVVIEVNSSGLRKPVKEIYPSLADLKIYCQEGVPITFGSDAHAPSEVGFAFDKAIAWAKAAGYQEYVAFEKRQIAKRIKL